VSNVVSGPDLDVTNCILIERILSWALITRIRRVKKGLIPCIGVEVYVVPMRVSLNERGEGGANNYHSPPWYQDSFVSRSASQSSFELGK
jgi:hypothetical protein